MGRIRRYRTALSRHHRSKGHGIHSPFAFNFVRFVLREKSPYYCYDEMGELRQAVVDSLRDEKNHPRVVSFKNLKMIFRITNRFNPPCILQVGSSYGLTSASMLSVGPESRLWLYDPNLETYSVTARVLMSYLDRVECYNKLDVCIDEYRCGLPVGTAPFVLVNSIPEEYDFELLCSALSEMLSENCVIMLGDLNRNDKIKRLWQHLKSVMSHGQSFTNEKTAVIVSQKKINLEHFFLWF